MRLVAATRRSIAVVDSLPAQPSAETVVEDVDVRCLAVDPSDPTRVYAGTQGGGVLRSDDGGTSWRSAGLSGAIVKALAVSHGSGTVWAGTKPPRLYRSDDGGDSWEELESFARMRRPWWWQPAEKPHTPYVSTLAAPSGDGSVVVTGIEAAKLLRSRDGGRSWTRLGRGVAADAHELAGDPRGGRMFLAAGFGASVSDDAGATWIKVAAGLDRRYAFCVAPDPGDNRSAFLAAAPMRSAHTANARACIFKLEDATWRKLAGGLPPELEQLPYALATSPLDPASVYMGLGDGTIWHSSDRGATWASLPVALDGLRRLVVSGDGARSATTAT